MSVENFFEDLLDSVDLKIDDDERKLIEEKHNALREALRVKLDLVDDFLTGSYRRHTMIQPKDKDEKFDVDFFIAFSKEEYDEKDLAELRGLIVTALNEIKDESSKIGITGVNDTQRRSVCVEFGTNFRIDVVPSIEIVKDELYKIYDRRTLKSVRSNPKLHGKLLTEANERTGGKLVPIIKILKSWRREKCDYVKSFHLELLSVEVLGVGAISSFAEGIAKFFSEAGSRLQQPCLTDPANSENYIDAYLDDDETRDDILSLISTENDIAEKAIESEQEGKNEDAVRVWKKIFGGEEDRDKDPSDLPPKTGPVIVDRTPPRPWGYV